MRKTLVTLGSKFTNAYLNDALVAKKFKVNILDNLNSSSKRNS